MGEAAQHPADDRAIAWRALLGAHKGKVTVEVAGETWDVRVDRHDEFADAAEVYLFAKTSDGKVPFVWSYWEGDDEDAWMVLQPRPAVVMQKGNKTIAAWPLDVPADATDEVIKLGLSFDEAFEDDPIPLARTRDWGLVIADPNARHTPEQLSHTPEQLSRVRGSPEKAQEAAPKRKAGGDIPDASLLSYYSDAVVRRPYTEEDHTKDVTISLGGHRESKRWKAKTLPLSHVIALLCTHKVGPKDGPAIVVGDMVPGVRRKTAVKSMIGGMLDVDTGMASETIDRRLLEIPYLAVRVTTHSHRKTESRFKRDEFRRHMGADTPINDDTLRQFVREHGKWDEEIANSVKFVEIDHEAGGIMLVARHKPMPKHRIFLPFKDTFNLGDEGATQAEAFQNWATVLTNLADLLAVPLDRSCLDPSRLFYLPRHDKGAPFEISLFGGELLDWRTLNKVDHFQEEMERLTGGVKSKGGPSTPEGKALARWAMANAHGFQIATVIEDHQQDRVRFEKSPGNLEVECPFDELHSNPGDPEDRGFFCVNAGDGTGDYFFARCRHDSCQGFNNLDHLGKMVKEGWFPQEVLKDPAYNLAAPEDAPNPEAAERIAKEDKATEAYRDLLAKEGDLSAEEKLKLVKLLLLSKLSRAEKIDGESAIRKKCRMTVGELNKFRAEALRQITDEAAEAKPKAKVDADIKEDATRLLSIAKRSYPLPAAYYERDVCYEASTSDLDRRPWVMQAPPPDKEKADWTRLHTPWKVTAGLRYADDDGRRGKRFSVLNHQGEAEEFDLPAEATVGKGTALLNELAARGAAMTNWGEVKAIDVAKQLTPRDEIVVVSTPGFHGDVFFSPWGEAVGPNAARLQLHKANRPTGPSLGGTEEAYDAAVTEAFGTGVMHWQLSQLLAYTSPVRDLCRMESRAAGFTGKAGRGKSTGHIAQAAVWGTPAKKQGVLGSFNGTQNAPEIFYAMVSGCGGAMDDAQLIHGAQLQDDNFKLADGTGKSRSKKDSSGFAKSWAWSGVVLTFSYEKPLAVKLKSENVKIKTGLGARLLEFPISDKKIKVARADEIKAAFQKNFGHGWRPFIEHLFDEGFVGDPDVVVREIEILADKLQKIVATDQDRSAEFMASIWWAGRAAQDAGLVPMEFPVPLEADDDLDESSLPKDSLDRLIYLAWSRSRKAAIAATDPTGDALRSLRYNLYANRGGRVALDGIGGYQGHDAFRLSLFNHKDFVGAVYVLPVDNAHKFIDGPESPEIVAKAAANEGGLLRPSTGQKKSLRWQHVPKGPPGTCYVFDAKWVEGDDPDPLDEIVREAVEEPGT